MGLRLSATTGMAAVLLAGCSSGANQTAEDIGTYKITSCNDASATYLSFPNITYQFTNTKSQTEDVFPEVQDDYGSESDVYTEQSGSSTMSPVSDSVVKPGETITQTLFVQSQYDDICEHHADVNVVLNGPPASAS